MRDINSFLFVIVKLVKVFGFLKYGFCFVVRDYSIEVKCNPKL